MSTLKEQFQNANVEYLQSFKAGDKPMPPARKVAVLTCMDARLHPEKFLGLEIGDSHVIRNAGGRASDDAIRSVAISQQLLGTREVHVIHHTDCGMVTFTSQQLADKIKNELGHDVGDRQFLEFSDLDQSVKDDVETVKKSPLVLPGTPVHGYVYDVKTGKLTEVV